MSGPRKRLARAAIAWLLPLVGVVACGDGGPPVWAPTPIPVGPDGSGCARARALRDRAPGLLEEGRVDRAVRVLQRAEELCPAEAQHTWGPRVTALAALGRSAEALQLAARIDRSDRASDADRKAAAAARTAAEDHAKAIRAAGARHDDPELYDPAEKRREEAADLHRRGDRALRAGDAAAAKKLFLDAWSTWHPNPRALVDAGLAARALGEKAEAQRLWDRATYDDAAASIRPEVPSGAPRAIGGAAMAWSKDGARLAIGGDESLAVHAADLAPVLRLHTGEAVTALAFAANDAVLVVGLAGGHARLYDAVLGGQRGELRGQQGPLRVIAPSSSGAVVATAGEDAALHLWDAATGVPGKVIASPRPVVAIGWSSNDSRLAFADDAGNLRVVEVASGAIASLPRPRGGAVRALSFDGAALFVVTAAERLRYDLDRPRAAPRTVARAHADAASFAPGSTVAVLDGASISAIDLAVTSPTSRADASARREGGPIAIALSPDRRAVAAVYRNRTLASIPASGSGPRRAVGPAAPLAALAVAPSGNMLAGASEDGRVLLWSPDPARLSMFAAPGARSLAFSPDGRVLAVGGDRRVDLRDVAADRAGPTMEAAGRVDSLAFTADGMRLAAGTDAPSVQVFASGDPHPRFDLKLEGGPVRAVRFSPDGRSLLLAPREGVVLWEPEAHKAFRFVPYGPEPRDVAFGSEGMIVADKRGQLLFGKPLEASPAPAQTVAVASQVIALTVAPNGLVATAEGDRAVTVRGPNGKPIQRYREADAAMRHVAFLPQGLVAVSFFDGTIRLFRGNGPGAMGTLRPAPGLPEGALAGLVETPSGHLESLGPDAAAARAVIRCRLGASLYPFEVCAEQLAVSGLFALLLAGRDPAEAEP